MPYKIFKTRSGKYRIYKTEGGKRVGRYKYQHSTRYSAVRQLRALYAHVEDAQEMTSDLKATVLEYRADVTSIPVQTGATLTTATWTVETPAPVAEMESEVLIPQDIAAYTPNAPDGQLCAVCAHWRVDGCGLVEGATDPQGSCALWSDPEDMDDDDTEEDDPVLEMANPPSLEGVDALVEDEETRETPFFELSATTEFRGKPPVIPTYPTVDIAMLTHNDSDPFYVVLPIAKVGAVSENNLFYDEALVDEIAVQLPGLGGVRGHIPEDQRATAFPLEEAHWVGHLRVADTLWAKGYIPPGNTREYIRMLKARGGKISTSIYGNGVIREEGGLRRMTALRLESVDLAPTSRAALGSALGGTFDIVSEMTALKGNDMEKSELVNHLSTLSANEIAELVGETRLEEMATLYAKKRGQRIIAAEMAAASTKAAETVAELESALRLRNQMLQEQAATIAEYKRGEFTRALNGYIAGELLNWQVSTERDKQVLSDLQDDLLRRTMRRIGENYNIDAAKQTALAEMASDEFKPLLVAERGRIAGSGAVVQMTDNRTPQAIEVTKLHDPAFASDSRRIFNF